MKRSALCVLPLLLLVGCGFSERSLVGKWTGKVELSEKDKAAAKDNPAASAAQSLAEALKMEIEFKADHTYKMTMEEGKWAYADHKVTLTPSSVLGMDVTKLGAAATPIVLNVSDDGKKLTMASNTSATSPGYVFTKDEAK